MHFNTSYHYTLSFYFFMSKYIIAKVGTKVCGLCWITQISERFFGEYLELHTLQNNVQWFLRTCPFLFARAGACE